MILALCISQYPIIYWLKFFRKLKFFHILFLNWKFVVKLHFLNQKLLFCYRKYGVQARYWNPYKLTLLLSRKICFCIFFIFESKHVQNLISKESTSAYKYHAISRFIDYLCAINNDDEFLKSFKCIYLGN